MENASKALIIAGSILISILLITVGLTVFKSTSGMSDQVSSSSESMAVSAFNSRFAQYFGTNVSGSEVITFINTVITSNSVSERKVTLNLYKKPNNTNVGGHTIDPSTLINHISVSKKYSIKMTPRLRIW